MVEPIAGEQPRSERETDRFIAELRALGARSPVTRDVDRFLFHPGFPVDVRHNAKIDREELKRWAEEKAS